MKTRPLAIALLLAIAPATFPAVAYAQAGADDATTNMARERFKEGVEFYDKGQYEQARASFLQAYALKKHPAVLLNLAWSCVKSGHALEGEKYFKTFLSESKDITDKQRADAQDGLTQARGKLCHIDVAAPPGTEVTVDGEKVGTAPLSEPVSVEAGAHTVKFKGPDGATDTQSVTVLGGEKQTAHFGKGGSAPATLTPPPSTGTEPGTTPSTTEAKPAEEAKPEEKPKADVVVEAGGTSVLSRPANLVPVFVLGGIAVAGFGTAIALGISKSNAQTQANNTANIIVANGGGASTCTPVGLQQNPKFGPACSAYATDNNQVNQDATG
ncbi:MAG: PEGA domain-containing protein, partial [Polyangiaceae bacterium]